MIRSLAPAAPLLVAGMIAAATAQAAPPPTVPASGAPAPADPKRDALRRALEERLSRLTTGLDGAVGYRIVDLETGEVFEHNAGTVFPAASTIKVPIFLELLRQAERGTLDLHHPSPVDPGGRVGGGGVLETLPDPLPELSPIHLAALMMDFSDNWATNILIDRVGMERVSASLQAWGLKKTLLRRKMMDLGAARAGRENVSTPRDMTVLLEALHSGRILGPESTRLALEIMKRNAGTPLKRGLPPGAEAADKEGDLEGVRCGSGIVFVPARREKPGVSADPVAAGARVTRPVAISVMTANSRGRGGGGGLRGGGGARRVELFRETGRVVGARPQD